MVVLVELRDLLVGKLLCCGILPVGVDVYVVGSCPLAEPECKFKDLPVPPDQLMLAVSH